MNNEQQSDFLLTYLEDATIRKRWLICSLLGFIVYPLGNTIYMLLSPHDFGLSSAMAFWTSAILLIGNLIWFWVTYSIAYKKFGTKWLTYLMCMTALQLIWPIKEFLWEDLHVGPRFNLATGILLDLWWLYQSWELRKANRRRYLAKQYPELASEGVALLSQSTNREELIANFQQLKQKWPHLEPLLSKFFESHQIKMCELEIRTPS